VDVTLDKVVNLVGVYAVRDIGVLKKRRKEIIPASLNAPLIAVLYLGKTRFLTNVWK
jgi:hypothetical protein